MLYNMKLNVFKFNNNKRYIIFNCIRFKIRKQDMFDNSIRIRYIKYDLRQILSHRENGTTLFFGCINRFHS